MSSFAYDLQSVRKVSRLNPYRGFLRALINLFIPIASIMVFWYALVYFSGLPAFVVPQPSQVLLTLIRERALFASNLAVSAAAAFMGFALANLIGFGLAALFVLVPILRTAVMPLAITIRNVPYVILITVLVLALGDGMLPRVLVVALSSFFPVLSNCYRGLLAVDQTVLDRMHVLGAKRWTVFWRVRVPFSVPYMIVAQEITATAALITTIAVEWMMASSGLGYVVQRASALYRGDEVYAVAFLAAIISYAIHAFVRFLGNRLDWQ